METFLYSAGVLAILVGILISIGLHELGHLLPAKLFRVQVTQFMVGFGKTLFSRRIGKTEYGVKLLPLGGYVRLTGMLPPGASGAESDAAPLQLASGEREFYKLPVWQKIIIMAGGPLVNLLLGVVLFAVLLSGIGVQQPTLTVGHVVACLKAPSASGSATCAATDLPAPAAAAGIRPGDKLVAINDKKLENWQQSRIIFGESAEKTLRVTVLRGDKKLQLQVTPAATERVLLDAHGNPLRTDRGYRTEIAGVVGLSPAHARTQLPLTAVPDYVGQQLAQVTGLLFDLPNRLVQVAQAAFGQQQRALDGPIGMVGVGRIAGEISASQQLDLLDRVAALVGLLAGLNIALFVFNLIPLPPFDGGHIAAALYEGLKRGVFRVLRKPHPAPVDISKLMPVTIAVVAFFLAMSLLLLYADIVKPVTLNG